MRISPDNKQLLYSGRIDWSDKEKPVWVFPCTSVKMRFTGNELKVFAENHNGYWDNSFGYVLDGELKSAPLPKAGETVIDIPVGETADHTHEILLYKRQDSCHEVTFMGFEIGDGEELLDAGTHPARHMEFYGDSVSAGEVSEAVDYVGKPDPEHNGQFSNSWYSYAWMTARKLGAQIHDIAQGGIALLDHTGWYCEPDAVGMETAWNKIHYSPIFGEKTDWDFKNYTPEVVVVAIGQNDNHPDDYMKEDYDGERAQNCRAHYKAFLEKLRSTYPDAYIVCITTLLEHDASWDRAIGEAVQATGDKKISQCLFKRNGAGTPGHLRIPEAEEMSEELTAYIKNLHVEGWE